MTNWALPSTPFSTKSAEQLCNSSLGATCVTKEQIPADAWDGVNGQCQPLPAMLTLSGPLARLSISFCHGPPLSRQNLLGNFKNTN